MSRRTFLAGTAAMAAAGALGGYAWFVEPHWLEVVQRPMPIEGLPAGLNGARLVHLSDIHVGRAVSDEYVLDTFAQVAAMEPDIVAVTGDFVSYHPRVLEQAERVYSKLPRGRLATLGVLGNHDHGLDWSDEPFTGALSGVLGDCGVTLLGNEKTEVEGLQVVGFDDYHAGCFNPERATAGLKPGQPSLALTHNPDTVDMPGWGAFEGWILAGHTHGGQCRPPFLSPPILPVENPAYAAGEVAIEGLARRLYVSRGVGHLTVRARFNVRPEVTVFTLTSA